MYALPGVIIAGVGFLILFVLLGSIGALAKSRQFAALGELGSGRAGSGKRALFFVALAMLFLGACGTFAGVGMNDAARRRACTETCATKGHPRGVIGPSRERDPKRPNMAAFVACACSGGEGAPVELRADSL